LGKGRPSQLSSRACTRMKVNDMNEKRILIVEDDEKLLHTYQSILQEEGYFVETATTGNQALDKAKKTKFHLVILDIKLPDIMGDEVAKGIKAGDDKVPIIMITGYPTLQRSIDSLELGIYEILIKPVGIDELLRIVHDALSNSCLCNVS